MTDYISREAAIELGYWHGERPTVDNPFPNGVDAVDTVDIENIPAADVQEVKRGKWISQRDGKTVVKVMYGEPIDSCFCSACHEWLVASDEYDVKGNYCPNCGADMREEQT